MRYIATILSLALASMMFMVSDPSSSTYGLCIAIFVISGLLLLDFVSFGSTILLIPSVILASSGLDSADNTIRSLSIAFIVFYSLGFWLWIVVIIWLPLGLMGLIIEYTEKNKRITYIFKK